MRTNAPVPPDEWDALVADHGPAVWATICRVLGDDRGAADCFQDTFAQFLVASRRRPVAHPLALLKSIAVRRGVDEIRRRATDRRRLEPLAADHANNGSSPHDILSCQELDHLLREALLALPPGQAIVFALIEFEQADRADVARILGITPNHVAVVLHRAKAALQRRLAGQVEPRLTGGDR